RNDKWLEESVIPDKCSASCAPIRKPDVFRAEGAAYSGRIDRVFASLDLDFWIPDPRSASPHLSGKTARGRHTRKRRSNWAHSDDELNCVQMS
ncbi:MAG: hypothetical protein AAGF82_23260, partial [Pseudomonadota bacterium]